MNALASLRRHDQRSLRTMSDDQDLDDMRIAAIKASGFLCNDGVRRWFTGKVGRNIATGLAAAEFADERGTNRIWILADGKQVPE